ncbi:hypothetical protein HDU67_007600 [Dinochytrium kinnereticum]|nr:hypothetical protein HDU67_007600 [Dinochytrium kinnereticum]
MTVMTTSTVLLQETLADYVNKEEYSPSAWSGEFMGRSAAQITPITKLRSGSRKDFYQKSSIDSVVYASNRQRAHSQDCGEFIKATEYEAARVPSVTSWDDVRRKKMADLSRTGSVLGTAPLEICLLPSQKADGVLRLQREGSFPRATENVITHSLEEALADYVEKMEFTPNSEVARKDNKGYVHRFSSRPNTVMVGGFLRDASISGTIKERTRGIAKSECSSQSLIKRYVEIKQEHRTIYLLNG